MIIKKIILENFRIHKYLEFEPAEKGITSIMGENGSGKSSIVDGFSWCLFGTRLRGLSNKHYIREGVDSSEETVKVEAHLRINNEDYVIERQIKTANGTTQCRVLKDNELIAGPTVTHAEEFIRRITGLDKDGFLASIFVQQKQVDEIISATPSKRSAVIEKLLGIEAITTAIKLAKGELKQLEKSLGLVKKGDIETSEKDVKESARAIKSTQKEITELKKSGKELQTQVTELDKFLKLEKSKEEAYKDLHSKIEGLKSLLTATQRSIEEDMRIYKSTKSRTKAILSIDGLDKKDEDLSKTIKDLTSEIAELKIRIQNDSKVLETKVEEDLLNQEQEIRSSLKKINSEEKQNARLLSDKESELRRNNQFLDLLKEGVAICPTCGNDIKASDKHVEETEEIIDKLSKDIVEINKTADSVEEERKHLETKIEEIEQIKDLIKKKEKIRETFKENNNTLSAKEAELKTYEAEYKVIRKQIEDYNRSKDLEKLKSDLSQKIKNSNKQLEKQELQIKDLGEELSKIKVNKDLPKMEKEFNEMSKDLNNIIADLKALKERDRLQKENYKVLKKILEENQKAREEYNSLARSCSVMQQSIESMGRFKADRLNKSIPQLISIASDILNRFTEGNFTELILDEKFYCFVVTKDGEKRPVEQLSGGELSSAAIALRFAISLLLSQSTDNLLILDEVLVSLSEHRAEEALKVISSMTENTQIILIAHNSYSDTIADKVIFLEKGEENE